MPRSTLLRWFALVGVFALGACSSGGGTDPGGSITLNVSVSNLSVAQGATGTVVATIARSGDFDGAVAITIENLPANVTASANPSSIPAGSTTSTITFTVGAGATAATTTVTVRASGSGVTARTQTVSLTVTSSSASGYSFGLSQSALSIQQGNQAQTTLTLTRTGGFTGNVAFSSTGAPNLMTVNFNPTQGTGNTTTVTVAAGQGLAAQTYPITLKGTATGLADVTIALNVTVTTSGGGGGSSSFLVCPQGDVLFAAYQDANGAWTRAVVTGDRFPFNFPSGRGAVAYVYAPGPTSYSTTIVYGTATELSSPEATVCPTPTPTKTINGSVANVAANEQAIVGLGTASAFVFPLVNSQFTMPNVPDLTTDLIATRNVFDDSGGVGSIELTSNKIIVRRSQDPAANSTLPVLDFNAAEAVTPVERTLTVMNLGADVVSPIVVFGSNLATAASTSVGLYTNIPGANQTTWPHPTHPAPGPNDLHGYQLVTAFVNGANRTLGAYYGGESQDRTLTLGPAIGPVNVTTVATVPTARFRAQYTTQTELNKGWSIAYTQTAAGTGRSYTTNVFPSYQGASTAFDFTVPDFSGLLGWQGVWGLVVGVPVTWTFSAVGGNGVTLLDGSIATIGTRRESITP